MRPDNLFEHPFLKGGAGSGNYGHAGRVGIRGGSLTDFSHMPTPTIVRAVGNKLAFAAESLNSAKQLRAAEVLDDVVHGLQTLSSQIHDNSPRTHRAELLMRQGMAELADFHTSEQAVHLRNAIALLSGAHKQFQGEFGRGY